MSSAALLASSLSFSHITTPLALTVLVQPFAHCTLNRPPAASSSSSSLSPTCITASMTSKTDPFRSAPATSLVGSLPVRIVALASTRSLSPALTSFNDVRPSGFFSSSCRSPARFRRLTQPDLTDTKPECGSALSPFTYRQPFSLRFFFASLSAPSSPSPSSSESSATSSTTTSSPSLSAWNTSASVL